MRHFLRFFIICFSFSVCAMFSAQTCAQEKTNYGIQDPRAAQIVDKVAARLNKGEGIFAKFAYYIYMNSNLLNTGYGNISIKKNKYKLNLDKIYTIYCDESNVYGYYVDIQELSIQKYASTNDELNPLAWFSKHKNKFRIKYIKRGSFNGKECDVVDLIPTVALSIVSIRLYSDPSTFDVIAIDTYDRSEQMHRYIIESIDYTKKYSNDFFVPNIAELEKAGVWINDLR